MRSASGSPWAIHTRHIDRSPALRLAGGHLHPSRRTRVLMAASLTIAVVLAVVSVLGIVFGLGGLYGDPAGALGPMPSTSGVLVPGFLGQDLFNLVVGVPLLLGVLWFVRGGNTVATLLWPGAQFYILYTFAIYLIGAPFSGLFLLYALLVALSGYATIALLAALDSGPLCKHVRNVAPARSVG